mmetsp:Transcript_10123/g.42514  ORF Transcript_10123/g.42514 Transcript_10123/m.42514 type:complete len:86 (+) Transcript_10123:179-436(+)
MEETRESRMNSVVEMAISSTLESCSNENFLACFAEFQSEEDKKALLNLRELFLQLLASSIKVGKLEKSHLVQWESHPWIPFLSMT